MKSRTDDPRRGLREALNSFEKARRSTPFGDPLLGVYAAVVAEEGWRLLEELEGAEIEEGAQLKSGDRTTRASY